MTLAQGLSIAGVEHNRDLRLETHLRGE